jgi:gamma-polyglutamate biosynthesis protein CapA
MINDNSQQILLNFVGDIMLGDSYHMLGIGVGSSLLKNSTQSIFNKVAPLLKQADVNIGNLECVISDVKCKPGSNIKPYVTYASNQVQQLKEAGFQILCLANNHTMQYGKDIFKYTEEYLNNRGMQTVGSVNNPYQIIIINDMKIAVVNYSLRPHKFNDPDIQYIEGNKYKIIEDVKGLSSENDYVIILLHWGDEYVDYPNQEQINLAHEIIDAGGAIIVGHHPHILQGIEYYKKGVIAYSLGNFVFDKPQALQRKSVILQAVLTKEGLRSICLIPIYINSRYQPEIAADKNKKDIEKIINQTSRKIASCNGKQNKYHRDLSMGTLYMRIQFFIYFLFNFYKYPRGTFLSLFLGALKRNLHWRKS